MFHYLVEKSKALPASVVITISWPYLRAKVFISSGWDTDGLRENISEEMTDGGMSWESQQCVSSSSMPLPMRPWILQVASVLYLPTYKSGIILYSVPYFPPSSSLSIII